MREKLELTLGWSSTGTRTFTFSRIGVPRWTSMMSADDEDVGWEDEEEEEDVGWEDEVQVLLLNSWTEERSQLEAVGEQFIVCSTGSSFDESHFGSTELRTISVSRFLILSTTEWFFSSIISFSFHAIKFSHFELSSIISFTIGWGRRR